MPAAPVTFETDISASFRPLRSLVFLSFFSLDMFTADSHLFYCLWQFLLHLKLPTYSTIRFRRGIIILGVDYPPRTSFRWIEGVEIFPRMYGDLSFQCYDRPPHGLFPFPTFLFLVSLLNHSWFIRQFDILVPRQRIHKIVI